MKTLTVKEQTETKVARPIPTLVPLIREEIDAGNEERNKAGLEHYQRAGELLLEAKDQVDRGDWGPWLKRNFALSKSTAWSYMKLAKVEEEKFRNLNVSFSEFIQPDREKRIQRPAYHADVESVRAKVDVDRLARERQNKEKELRLMRELARQLIDIGYKVLATKLHPDKLGGSPEAMRRLNEVRRRLRAAI